MFLIRYRVVCAHFYYGGFQTHNQGTVACALYLHSQQFTIHRQVFIICTSHIFFCYTAEMCSCCSAPTFYFKVLCVEIFLTFFKESSLGLVKWLIGKGTYCQA